MRCVFSVTPSVMKCFRQNKLQKNLIIMTTMRYTGLDFIQIGSQTKIYQYQLDYYYVPYTRVMLHVLTCTCTSKRIIEILVRLEIGLENP